MMLRKLAMGLILAGTFAMAQDAKKTDKAPAKEVVDPVCGMTVDPATSVHSEYKGKTYYFCSDSDKKDFDKAPASYIKLDKKDTTKK